MISNAKNRLYQFNTVVVKFSLDNSLQTLTPHSKADFEICMERRMDHCWNSSETSVPQWSKETKLELSLADKNVAG